MGPVFTSFLDRAKSTPCAHAKVTQSAIKCLNPWSKRHIMTSFQAVLVPQKQIAGTGLTSSLTQPLWKREERDKATHGHTGPSHCDIDNQTRSPWHVSNSFKVLGNSPRRSRESSSLQMLRPQLDTFQVEGDSQS